MTRDLAKIECSECGNFNYLTTRNKSIKKERYTFKKYCKHCRKHTKHKEVK